MPNVQSAGVRFKLRFKFLEFTDTNQKFVLKQEIRLSPPLCSVEFFSFFQFFLSKFMSDIPSKFSNTSVTSPFNFAIFDMNNSDYILMPATFRANSFLSFFLNHI